MTHPAYPDLDEAAQVELLRGVALDGLADHGLEVAGLALVMHGFNTTFRADTAGGRRLAVRVNTNSQSTAANIRAQHAWLRAIASETDVLVPDPVLTRDGRSFTRVRREEVDRDFDVVVATWLDGDDVGRCDATIAGALGRAMATLHEHAARWRLPEGGALPLFDEPLFGDTDLLSGRDSVLDESLERCREAFAGAYAGRSPIVVHGDLHGGNLKWHAGRLAVFDVDDCGLALPAVDLAVATFYLRDGEPSREAALREGYAAVRPLPEEPPEHVEAFVAARQLLLANSLLASTTAGLRADAERYLEIARARLRGWLDAGRFVLDPGW